MKTKTGKRGLENDSYKFVMLGESGVGKTSISVRFVKGYHMDSYEPTIGACFLRKQFQHENKIYKIDIWDTAGQERYFSLAPFYYRNANAAIVAYDISNAHSFDKAKDWINELNKNTGPDLVIALVGNKIDLETRQVSIKEGKEYADELGLIFMEVSAKSNINVQELFIEISKKLPANPRTNEELSKLTLSSSDDKNAGSNCNC